MPSPWDYWRTALAGRTDLPPLHEGEVHIGYYRYRARKDGPMLGLAIFEDEDGEMAGLTGIDDGPLVVDPETLYHLFSRACRNPVSYEVWEAYRSTGRWSDVDAAAAATQAASNRGELSEEEQLVDNLAELERAVDAYEVIGDDETATKAAGLRQSIGKITTALDKMRETQKRPHLEAGRAVDEHFRPFVQRGKDADGRLKRALDAFMTEKLRQQRAAEAAARAAQEAAERAAREQAAKGAEPAPMPPTAPPQAETVLPQKIQTVTGRAMSVGIKKIPRIVDVDKVIARYRNAADFLACLNRLVEADVARGIIPDGVEVEEVANTRR